MFDFILNTLRPNYDRFRPATNKLTDETLAGGSLFSSHLNLPLTIIKTKSRCFVFARYIRLRYMHKTIIKQILCCLKFMTLVDLVLDESETERNRKFIRVVQNVLIY